MFQSFSKIILFSAAFLLTAFSIQAQTWKILPGYNIKFSGRSAEGTFSGLSGIILFDPANPTSGKFDVQVSANTINTGNTKKNSDARGSSWLNTSKYPIIHFVSKSIAKSGAGFVVKGTMTMHGVSLPVSIPFTFQEKGSQGQFTGKLSLTRQDYNINGPMMSFIVGSDFDISLMVPVGK
ncbi:MAG: YceI family protein [Chitinophagaceae bacterium]